MRQLVLAAVLLAAAVPVAAQTPEPPPAQPVTPPAPPAQQPTPPPPEPKPAGPPKWFFGGGVGATFGTIDTISVAPMIGYHVIPRLDVGTQVWYSWVNDGRYSPDLETDEYGALLFTRFRLWRSLFAEADYQYTSYEYLNAFGDKDRANYDSFLAGGGYAIPLGGRASMYFSVLYDFGYDDNDFNRAYDSPWRVQIGAMVGF